MPIATCLLSPSLLSQLNTNGQEANEVIRLWSEMAQVSSEQMTLFFQTFELQCGQHYEVFVTLYLPTLWKPQQVDMLQTGLAQAISRYFAVDIAKVLVCTQMVNSENVVENGQTLTW